MSRPLWRGARRIAAVGLLVAALSSPAFAQAPPVNPDDFVAAVAGSDQYEIMAARLALTESRDPAVRAFAREMIRDHVAALGSLAQAAGASGLPAPSASLGPEQAAFLGALQGARGADFDRAYTRQQNLAHASALATERGYAEHGSDLNLRSMAAANLPMIQRHAHMASELASLHGG